MAMTNSKAASFCARVPDAMPIAADALTKEQFDAEMQKGTDDIAAGRVVSAADVENEIRDMFGLGA